MKSTPSFVLNCLVCLLFFSFPSSVFAQRSNDPDLRYKNFYENAETALVQNKISQADFWIARYIGEVAQDPRRIKTVQDLLPIFKRHPHFNPSGTLSAGYDSGFLKWFVFGSYAMWGVPDPSVDNKNFEFKIQSSGEETYFASLIAKPYCQSWLILQSKDLAPAMAVLAGGPGQTPYLVLGKQQNDAEPVYFEGVPLPLGENPLQYVWPLEFSDVDEDGVPELWVRYNVTWMTGFTQELAIYKIGEQGLQLMKKFSGNFEGIARREEGNIIEVAQGAGAEKTEHFETWIFRNGDFQKIKEWDAPNILSTDNWKKYYLTDD